MQCRPACHRSRHMYDLLKIRAEALLSHTSPTEAVEVAFERLNRANDLAMCISLKRKPVALAEAAALERAGPAGLPLYGRVFAVKDNIDVAGLETTAACPAFAYRPAASAVAVRRLEDAGAIVIGKTNLDQFAT